MTFQALQTMSSTTSIYDDPPDMSDVGEGIRWAEAHQGNLGVGEIPYDPDGEYALGQLTEPRG